MMIRNIRNALSLMLPIKSYVPKETLPDSRKRGETPPNRQVILMKITQSDKGCQ